MVKGRRRLRSRSALAGSDGISVASEGLTRRHEGGWGCASCFFFSHEGTKGSKELIVIVF